MGGNFAGGGGVGEEVVVVVGLGRWRRRVGFTGKWVWFLGI